MSGLQKREVLLFTVKMFREVKNLRNLGPNRDLLFILRKKLSRDFCDFG